MASVDITDLRMKLGMSSMLAEITCGLLEERLLTQADIRDTGTSSPRVVMQRIRAKLHSVGVELSSQRRLGYWLEDGEKIKLVQLCTPDPDNLHGTESHDVSGE